MNEHDIVAEWLQIAHDDYDAALYLYQKPHRKPLEIICYHCQQSTEKSLKAFLCAHDIVIPKTHETGFLCQLCVDINDSFKEYLVPCEELAIYAIETRYPIRIEIDDETARRNLEQALNIYNFVVGLIKPPIPESVPVPVSIPVPVLDIDICKLTPDHADSYVHFFDVTPHDENVDDNKCYCVCWSNDDYEGKDFSTREKRREAAIRYVQNGNIQGYVAYRGANYADRTYRAVNADLSNSADRPDNSGIIGWCNANTKSDCLKCCSWRMFMGAVPTEEPESGLRIKSIFCFTINPDFKRRGIATRMLERVCLDAALDGFDFVEAYPRKGPVDENINFGGSIEFYIKNGFFIYCETDNILVMRKQLNVNNR